MVSIILPNYNHAKYLEQRINSILQQSYRDFELIILDDCSTDGSRSVIEKYRSADLIKEIVYNDKNTGSVFRQWYRGLERAGGEYIWIAESDDYADSQFLAHLVPFLDQNKAVGLVYCNSGIVDSGGASTGKTFSDLHAFRGFRHSGDITFPGRTYLNDCLFSWCSINNASAVLFRADVLKKHLFDLRKFYYAGDWATYISVALQSDIAYCDKVLSFYRDHAGNASRKAYTSGRMYIDEFRIVSRVLKHFPDMQSRKAYILSKYHVLIEHMLRQLSYKRKLLVLFRYLTINPLLLIRYLLEALRTAVKGRN